jgi:hypothetical protein
MIVSGADLRATFRRLEVLIAAMAVEANHEPIRRRRQRLDAAFDASNSAAAGSR